MNRDQLIDQSQALIDAAGPFVRGYLGCALWLLDEDEEKKSTDGGFIIAEVHPHDVRQAIEDCEDFQTTNRELLERAYDDGQDTRHGRMSYGPENAGHDFWLTRCGHGAGFWDRGLGAVGKELTAMSKPYGDVYLYVGDDNLLHFG